MRVNRPGVKVSANVTSEQTVCSAKTVNIRPRCSSRQQKPPSETSLIKRRQTTPSVSRVTFCVLITARPVNVKMPGREVVWLPPMPDKAWRGTRHRATNGRTVRPDGGPLIARQSARIDAKRHAPPEPSPDGPARRQQPIPIPGCRVESDARGNHADAGCEPTRHKLSGQFVIIQRFTRERRIDNQR